MAQTTVGDMTAAREGLMLLTFNHDVLSRVAEADLPAGRFVTCTGVTNTHGCALPAATGEVTDGDGLGITIWQSAKEYLSATHEYEEYDQVPVCRKGQIWVMAEDAVTEGNAVFVRFTAAGSEELGRMRSDADGGDAVAIPSAIWRTSTTAVNQLALVELNLPGAIV